MQLEKYIELQKTTLDNHSYTPYERDNEGLVYIGVPKKIDFLNKQEKYEFVYLLCMLIAFDLKIYETLKDDYIKLKKDFYIPKFEYGLTNTFIYPDKIFNQYKIGINDEYFLNSFNLFQKICLSLIKKNNTVNNYNSILYSIGQDKDLNCDLFGKSFKKCIDRKLNSINIFKNTLHSLKSSSWEIIIPYLGQNLPSYFSQGNCDILPNKTGILIFCHVFIELMEKTSLLSDFNKFYFYNNFDRTEKRYQMDFITNEIDADEIYNL